MSKRLLAMKDKKDKNSLVTLKKLAEEAIAKHSRRIFKHEAEVLKDKDPEDLHQTRVGMRRLQSAIAQCLGFPEIAPQNSCCIF